MSWTEVAILAVIGVLLAYLFCKYYWRVQLVTNKNLLHDPSEAFDIYEPLEEEYNSHVKQGINIAKGKRLIIAGLLRDRVDVIPSMLEKVRSIGKYFRDYKLLVVENDSVDGTRDELRKAVISDARLEILGCGVNVPECKYNDMKTEGHSVTRGRIDKMTRLRNIYMDRIQEAYSGWDYVLMWDLDLVSVLYPEGVMNSIAWMEELGSDTMSANGVYKWGPVTVYYDTYGHTEMGDIWITKDKLDHDFDVGASISYQRGERPVKVISSFGGATLYRLASIVGKRYEFSPEDNIKCEHTTLHEQLQEVYVNPSMCHLILSNE